MLYACMRSGRRVCQGVLMISVFSTVLLAQQSLTIPDATVEGFSPTQLTVVMTNEAPVQGYVLAAVPSTVASVAVTVTCPGASPVNNPVASILAIVLSDTLQL